ncbi:hypothetical protein KAR48_20710 [bacterium]|nr:hypothetical protein [bacterium]
MYKVYLVIREDCCQCRGIWYCNRNDCSFKIIFFLVLACILLVSAAAFAGGKHDMKSSPLFAHSLESAISEFTGEAI